jgi:hypothetical protein
MVEEQAYAPPAYKRPPRTHIVRVIETRGRRYNCYRDGTLLCSEVTQPFAAAAHALRLEFASPDDLVVFKVGGVSGLEHEAMVRKLGDIAGGPR